VDILVNNAGIYEFALTPDSDDAFFDRHFHLNVRAPHILVGALVPGMVERGRGVVNVSSAVGSHPGIEAGIYGASKAALELLTKAWANEFGTKGVRVNAAASGPSKTPPK
jgi:NAD(P)-dependent dehydrogenase (short-subunit alcohol dehydrogenase family)